MKRLLWLLLCSFCLGQSPVGIPVALSPKGTPLANVQVAICSGQPNLTTPCGGTTLLQTYTTSALSVTCTLNAGFGPMNGAGCTNPGLTDQVGNVIAFSGSGGSWCQYYGPQVSGVIVQPCQVPVTGAGINTFGNINGTEVVDGVRNVNLPAAIAKSNSSGGTNVLELSGHTETLSAPLAIGTAPIHLHFNNNSTITCAFSSSGSCMAEGANSRISGDTVSSVTITGAGTFAGDSLLSNSNTSEYFQFDHLFVNPLAGGTYNKAVVELEGGYIPSYFNQNVLDCAMSGTCFHATVGANSGEGAGDYTLDQDWFNCVNVAGCLPMKFDNPGGTSSFENVHISNSAIEHQGCGQNLAQLSGGIFDIDFLNDRFEANPACNESMVTATALHSLHFDNPFFTGTGAAAYGVELITSIDDFHIFGAFSANSRILKNNINGRNINTAYEPFYVYSGTTTIPSIFDSNLIVSSAGNGNQTLGVHFNSGALSGGSSQQTDVTFEDQGTAEWDLQKASNENFQILDSVNSSKARLGFTPGAATSLNSGGSAAVNVNTASGSGSGGLVIGDGGGTNQATITVTAGVPGGNCAVGSIDLNRSAANASTVLYVCGTTNTWTAVTVP